MFLSSPSPLLHLAKMTAWIALSFDTRSECLLPAWLWVLWLVMKKIFFPHDMLLQWPLWLTTSLYGIEHKYCRNLSIIWIVKKSGDRGPSHRQHLFVHLAGGVLLFYTVVTWHLESTINWSASSAFAISPIISLRSSSNFLCQTWEEGLIIRLILWIAA